MRIILFDIDCLRPDHLGCYGYRRPTSPNIDRIAGGGTRFERYYCADSPCLPSRTDLISGRFGINSGVVSNLDGGRDFRLPMLDYGGPRNEYQTLPRQLRKRAGLDTISFSNFADRHLAMWFAIGWSEMYTPNLKGGQETAEEVNEPVLRWLRANATREDYLLHINYWDTHRYYKMGSSWAQRFKGTPPPDWPDEAAFERINRMDGMFTGRRQFHGGGPSPVALMPDRITSRADHRRDFLLG